MIRTFSKQFVETGTLINQLRNTPIEAEQRYRKTGIIAFHGDTDAVLKQPFNIIASNDNDQPKTLHKAEQIAIAWKPLGCIIHLIIGYL